ncbi:Cof-type HAD-IIB family hydrolase [Bifidobacterium leontopitheci]|uniref:Haloacid dehalogenase n=1 Tax=Bifidobacterium leontopitheci TaxID=2650774 RepID=A0A6I1GKC9_9BIFI|nr:Cof-type HAD-IIB family hydrolase [Bifidobacterium leontopitheci]KAB7789899.1 haloacid dehalogenase [Bifidobacterium leontopitheci]
MTAVDWTAITPGPHDIRLIVADMDGTLLDGDSRIPDGFWPLLGELQARGVEFVPASGRQLATLQTMFSHEQAAGVSSFVAENGNVVMADGDIVDVHGVGWDLTRDVIDMVDQAVASGRHDIGLVVCGLKTAYIQRADKPFVDECSKYYQALRIVDDLHDVLGTPGETVLKLAIFDFGAAEPMADELLSDIARTWAVVVSGAHWVDIMDPATNKRQGVVALQRSLGVTPAQTAVFGDYLNDLEMFDAGEWSFAMANAHPDLKQAAHYVAPANTEHGVLTVVRRLLGIGGSQAAQATQTEQTAQTVR